MVRAASTIECCCCSLVISSTYVAELVVDHAATGVGIGKEAEVEEIGVIS